MVAPRHWKCGGVVREAGGFGGGMRVVHGSVRRRRTGGRPGVCFFVESRATTGSSAGQRGGSGGSRTSKVVVKTVQEPVVSARPAAGVTGLGLINTALLAVATSAFVAASWTFRSTMKTFDQACLDTTEAMRATERASKEVEILSLQLEREIPETLSSVESASEELEVLAQGLQFITGSVNKRIREPVQDAVALTVDTSTNVMKRVPNDLQFVSEVATTVLAEWRARLGDTIGNIDTGYFRQKATTKAQREAIDWIASWRARTAAMEEEAQEAEDSGSEIPAPPAEEVIPRKELAENKVAMALSAAEDAAAQAEIASGRLEKAMLEYESLSSYSE
ncbi:hypothetical protein HOP50_10g60530 [Chloropicon primus]|nr:hypothetical protein HOP50_10g60530 [Chloropicon primus]